MAMIIIELNLYYVDVDHRLGRVDCQLPCGESELPIKKICDQIRKIVRRSA